MKKIIFIICAALALGWYFLSNCSCKELSIHTGKQPQLDLRKFFDGELEGWGMLFDYKGRQKSTFTVTLKGSWNDEKGTLEEWFIFDDGHKLERKWDLEFANNKLIGSASDVPGGAIGDQTGNAFHGDYVLRVPYNHSTIDLKMDDWIYMIDGQTILNRTSMYKFGFKVGEMVLVIRKK